MSNIEILYEDSEIICCIKPIGVLSQSDENGKANMVDLLKEITKGDIFPLHRLDREVSGVMLYAKTKSAAAKLSYDIANNSFLKEYMALVHSKPQTACGEMNDLLFKDSARGKVFVVKRERKGVKKASLKYEVLDTKTYLNEDYSLVKILLITGRTHQIRVQFASRKMPLAGDKKYGAKDSFKKIGLWSYRITFTHPKTKEKLSFFKKPDCSENSLFQNLLK